MQRMQTPETMRVVYGVNELELALAGKTVRGIRKALERRVCRAPGDEIEFQKAAGVKGRSA